MTWRQTLQRRRIHSADLQTLELRYLGLFESIQNLRRESGVVVEVDDCLLVFLRKKKTEAAAKFRCSRWGGISIVAWRRDGGGRGVAPDFIGCGELRVRLQELVLDIHFFESLDQRKHPIMTLSISKTGKVCIQ